MRSSGDHGRSTWQTISFAMRPWVLAATILGSSMAFIDGTVVNVALPALQSGLGATVSDVQWIVESYALLLAALLLPGGSLGDLYGRRKIFATGVVVFRLGVCFLRTGAKRLNLNSCSRIAGCWRSPSRAGKSLFDQRFFPG